jgi:hypothetical protein
MTTNYGSRDSAVGIATRYGMDGPGIESRCAEIYSATVQTCPGAHPSFYTMRTGSFPGTKLPWGPPILRHNGNRVFPGDEAALGPTHPPTQWEPSIPGTKLPWDPPILLHNGYRVFPGDKAALGPTHPPTQWAPGLSRGQRCPGAHPSSYTMGTGSFPGTKMPWGPPILLYNGDRVFPGDKATRARR